MSLFEWRMKFCYRFLLLSFLFSSFFPECICTTLGIKKQNLTDPDNSTAGLIKDRHGTGGLSIMYVVFTIPRLYFFVSFCRPLLSTGWCYLNMQPEPFTDLKQRQHLKGVTCLYTGCNAQLCVTVCEMNIYKDYVEFSLSLLTTIHGDSYCCIYPLSLSGVYKSYEKALWFVQKEKFEPIQNLCVSRKLYYTANQKNISKTNNT